MAIDDIFFAPSALTTSTAISGKDASQLGMNDFFNLLVAQMTNQDMLNPMDDTEFISQMAMFSVLQGVSNVQEYQLSSYATSYAGKYVTIAYTNPYGKLEEIEGYVDQVTFYDGSPKVVVDGTAYDLYTVMQVGPGPANSSLTEASKYIGLNVKVQYEDEKYDIRYITGVVSTVEKDEKGIVCVVVDGKRYPATDIVAVVQAETDTKKDDDDTTGSGSDSSGSDSGAQGASLSTAPGNAAGTGFKYMPSDASRVEVNDM